MYVLNLFTYTTITEQFQFYNLIPALVHCNLV